jgi:hypothetical protein
MMASSFWKVAGILAIAGLFYVGSGLRQGNDQPILGGRAYAGGVGVATNDTETVVTTSDDGRTLYIWRYVGAKPPVFVGKTEVGARDR